MKEYNLYSSGQKVVLTTGKIVEIFLERGTKHPSYWAYPLNKYGERVIDSEMIIRHSQIKEEFVLPKPLFGHIKQIKAEIFSPYNGESLGIKELDSDRPIFNYKEGCIYYFFYWNRPGSELSIGRSFSEKELEEFLKSNP